MRSVTHFLRYSSLKCSKQTLTVRSAISFTSSVFSSEANGETEKNLSLFCGRFQSLLVAFRNSKTRRHGEIKQTRPSAKQDFSGEALSKQNTEASLASLSCNSSRAMTEWSAIFAFGVYFYLYRIAIFGFHWTQKICIVYAFFFILQTRQANGCNKLKRLGIFGMYPDDVKISSV